MSDEVTTAGRVVLEALRLDLEPEERVRERAERALDLGVGGFILFGGEATQVRRLVADLRESAGYALWIGSDLERGPGQQFRGLPTLPPPAGLAAHADPARAASLAGRITGRAARNLGIDLVFAPVLDLDVEPRNPIIGTRGFSGDEEIVARLGAAWIDGCQAEGVLACAKHFPGHGRSEADSHVEIPVIEASRAEMQSDLRPFRQVANRVAAIMADHVQYPGLGADVPATMSPEIIEILLRGELGFEGLVVTDAMNMSGFLDAQDGAAQAAVAALSAGCDLLVYPADLRATIAALESAALNDPTIASRLAAALERSKRARSGLSNSPGLDDDPDEASLSLATDCVLWCGEMPAWLRSERSVRVVPIWDDREQPNRQRFGDLFVEELKAAGWTIDDSEEGGFAIVLIASTPQAWKGTAGLTPAAEDAVRTALTAAQGALPVVFGHRRLLDALGGVGVCAWATEPTMERAGAQALVAIAGAAR
ncbi:MAG: glycoside hydrolase family 3 N-terminal domain-containing protein [Gemmatimonadota bacterium]